MDNLSRTLDFIKTNAVSADLAALDWNRFAKNNPQAYTFNQYQQFLEWGGSKYINAETLRKLWQGKEIADAYFYLRDENENKQMQQNGQVDAANENVGSPVFPLLGLPLIFLSKHYNQSKIMEEDDEYQAIVSQKKSQWLNNNPSKDFSSKEGLDYAYGSLENNETPALEKDVKAEIEKRKLSNENFRKRFEKKEKRWEKEKTKVYKNPKDNPLYAYKERQINEHTKERFKLLKKENPSIKEEDIRKQVENRTKKKQDQPSAFNQANQIRQLQGVANRIQQIQRVQTPPSPPQAPSPSPSPAPRPSSMPSPSSAISNVKNMVRLAQKAQKILKAARLATLLANPYVWIIIGVAVVVIIVFAIVFGSDSETDQTQLTGYCPNPEAIAANRKTTPETCKYLNPAINIFGNLTEQQINAYKEKYRAQSKRLDFDARVNDIVNKTRGVGLNPVIFLGYWKSEGSFSFSFGCDPRTPPFTFEAELDCTLGLSPNGGSATARCARSAIEKDPNKKKELEKGCELLKSIRKNKVYSNYPVSYPINTFDDFAETYGSAAPDLGDAATNFNCVNTYNTLVEVANNLNACTSSPQTTKAPSPATNTIVQKAFEIVQLLQKRLDDCGGISCYLFNFKRDEPKEYYWCTFLVIDSYNNSGFSGLTRNAHASVLGMKRFFQDSSQNGGNYKFLPPETPANNLRPGDVIFFEGIGQHVSLIKDFNLDESGNGTIKTYDSNNVGIEDVVFVKDNVLQKAQTTAKRYSITGFGTVNNL